MTSKQLHYLQLLGLAASLWAIYLVPWTVIGWLEPLKPTIIAILFTICAHRLRVASWPVVIAFGLMPFVEGIVEAYLNSAAAREGVFESGHHNFAVTLALWAVLFSPISLWGPLLSSVVTYRYVRNRPAQTA